MRSLSAKHAIRMNIRIDTRRNPSVNVSRTATKVRLCDTFNKNIPVLMDVCLTQLVSDLLSDNNFDTPEHDPKKRSICMCKEGFHCSDPKNCLTCVPHSLCKRGSGVQLPGTTRLLKHLYRLIGFLYTLVLNPLWPA